MPGQILEARNIRINIHYKIPDLMQLNVVGEKTGARGISRQDDFKQVKWPRV